MDPSTRLLSLSFAMLVGCYVFGSIPLSLSFSERNMRSVSIIGAGLIVGTALSVIIPEGVHALYERETGPHFHSGHAEPHQHHHKARTLNHEVKAAEAVGDAAHASGDKYWSELHGRLAPDVELHSMIGISLSFGFIFMLLIDQLCGGGHSHGSNSDSGKRQKSITATLGLLVHAAADGVALGAAATTTRTDIEMIVFVAIMLHKAPAAFGLSTFLLHESYERSRIRKHLLAFSLAAPLFAILTYFGLNQSGKETLSTYNATGLAMLFSAGTFLYVATVHILPELLSKSNNTDGPLNHDHSGKLSKVELFFLIIGIITPVILGLYHKH